MVECARGMMQDCGCRPMFKKKNNPKLYSLTKATLKFDLDLKITPYFYTEFYSPLNDYSASSIDKFRNCAGIEYQFSARYMIDINYMIQNKLDSKIENDYTIGLGYYFTL